MEHWLLAFSVFGLIPTVRAGEWDDFASNIATDLAPLITLFGERLTKQFLSESICTLDNFIFALAPLGILTAVVSVIRVCGNSSLRAFVGRAQEGPGEAEHELLSCVSETTAELFNAGGISRVFGRPRILEVVAWEGDDEKEGSFRIGTLRDAPGESAWCSSHDITWGESGPAALDIPNLSLNMGIKRRGTGWFYCAALFGFLLQGGVIAYSALTVFAFPHHFKHNDRPVPAYAFPFFILGTILLSTGMFFCAFMIERSSRKHYFYPTQPSKIFWLQPGQQSVGDQVFGAFLGANEGPNSQPMKNFTYIKSTKCPRPNGQEGKLLFAISLTMLGFLIQFFGLRSLHASVIVAQIGATLLMSVVRTCLRTKRIDLDENQLSNKERDLTSRSQQELDCFAFHLENIESFDLRSVPVNEVLESQHTFSFDTTLVADSTDDTSAKTNIIRTRTRLAELTSGANKAPNMAWDDLPIRKTAQSLARTIEMTMDVITSWGCKLGPDFDFTLAFTSQSLNRAFGSHNLDYHTIKLKQSDNPIRWRVDERELEAFLGLWTWSLLNSNSDWPRKGLFRLVGLDSTEAASEETDLYFHKWIYRQTEARMVSSKSIPSPHRLFGYLSDEHLGNNEILVVQTQNRLETMAAQDLYIRFLNAAFEHVAELGGTTDVVPSSHGTFFAQNTHIDDLVSCFEACELGSREDALLCIVPALRHQNLLPELAADSQCIRNRVEKSMGEGNPADAFSIVTWLCERSDGVELKRSIHELGFLCRRAILDGDPNARNIGYDQACLLLGRDVRTGYFQRLKHTRRDGWMQSLGREDWWRSFSVQLGWMVWHLAKTCPGSQHIQSGLEPLGITESSMSTPDMDGRKEHSEKGRDAFLQWLSYNERNVYDEVPQEDSLKLALDWVRLNNYDFLLHCLILVWLDFGKTRPVFIYEVILLIARCRLGSVLQTMVRRGVDLDLCEPDEGRTPLIQAAFTNETGVIDELLENGADIDGRAPNGATALIQASRAGNSEMVTFLISRGAFVDAQDHHGLTALFWASFSNNLDIIRIVLSKGAEIEKPNYDGNTALVVAREQDHHEALKLLLLWGADPNVQLDDGTTPLMRAVGGDDVLQVKILAEERAGLLARGRNGQRALELARLRGHPEIVSMLEKAWGGPE